MPVFLKSEQHPGKGGWSVLANMSESELESDLGKLVAGGQPHRSRRADEPVSNRDAMLGWIAVLEERS